MPYDPSPYLDPAKCALILFECQEAVIGPETHLQGLRTDVLERGMVDNIAGLLAAARESGVTVVYCNMAFREDGLGAPNTPRSDNVPPAGPPGPPILSPVVEPLTPRPEEVVIERIHGMTTFHGTPIESVLRDGGVETIVPTGVSLNIGIIATTVEALGRGYRVAIARDCCAGDPSEYADNVYRNTLNNLAYLSNSQDIAKVWRSSNSPEGKNPSH
ncbi:MAG: cysteine hydrolase [Myxococcota bacterium]